MAGRRARGRPVHGILLLDKPAGLRSNAVLQRVKWLYRARKAGHTGALDNLASGMLPICLGEATKISHYLLNADKRYLADFHLGVTTETGDADGAVCDISPVGDVDEARLRGALERFLGPIEQVPPMYSALKRGGRRLYELAYQGKVVEREARPVTIHALNMLGFDSPVLSVDVRCSKGTYIRALGEDVGQALGCGAHVSRLRRLDVGPFEARQMVSLEQVEQASMAGLEALDALLMPMDRALGALPRVDLGASSAFYLGRGQAVLAPRAPTEGLVRLYGEGSEFLGVGEILDDGRVAPRRLLAASD